MKPNKNKKRRHSNKPLYQIKIAKERIDILFDEAEKMVKKDKKLANRYVELARKIGMRYNVRIPSEKKRRFCKHCYAYLKPGITSHTKVDKGVVKITCLACRKKTNIPYK
jgi:ribonuclease P protein subunit RPR2